MVLAARVGVFIHELVPGTSVVNPGRANPTAHEVDGAALMVRTCSLAVLLCGEPPSSVARTGLDLHLFPLHPFSQGALSTPRPEAGQSGTTSSSWGGQSGSVGSPGEGALRSPSPSSPRGPVRGARTRVSSLRAPDSRLTSRPQRPKGHPHFPCRLPCGAHHVPPAWPVESPQRLEGCARLPGPAGPAALAGTTEEMVWKERPAVRRRPRSPRLLPAQLASHPEAP